MWVMSPRGRRRAGQGLEQRGWPAPLPEGLLGLLHVPFPQGLVRASPQPAALGSTRERTRDQGKVCLATSDNLEVTRAIFSMFYGS